MIQWAGLINRLKGKEQLIASARAEGQSADQALATTDDAVAQDLMANLSSDESDAKAELRLLRDFENSIEAGFQMATFQGPLCAEPVVGMAWVVENVSFNKEAEDSESRSNKSFPI
jgi:ribosome assembly protein 1